VEDHSGGQHPHTVLVTVAKNLFLSPHFTLLIYLCPLLLVFNVTFLSLSSNFSLLPFPQFSLSLLTFLVSLFNHPANMFLSLFILSYNLKVKCKVPSIFKTFVPAHNYTGRMRYSIVG
jgi:hypothetical protein